MARRLYCADIFVLLLISGAFFDLARCFIHRGQEEDIIVFEKSNPDAEARGVALPRDGCECSDWSCGCCTYFNVPRVGLNDTGCVNITYNSNQYALSFTVSFDNRTVFNKTISAKNPPPVCFYAPEMKSLARACLKFYNMTYAETSISGCLETEVFLLNEEVANYTLGCFNLGKASKYVKALKGSWNKSFASGTQLENSVIKYLGARMLPVNLKKLFYSSVKEIKQFAP